MSEIMSPSLISLLIMIKYLQDLHTHWGTTVTQWLRCCATNRKVAGSIPASVSGIFH